MLGLYFPSDTLSASADADESTTLQQVKDLHMILLPQVKDPLTEQHWMLRALRLAIRLPLESFTLQKVVLACNWTSWL